VTLKAAIGLGPRAVARREFKKELKEEAAVQDELLQHSETIQAVRLQELRWKAKMQPAQQILYGLNELKTLAPPPLPGRWCEVLVWVFALAYVGFMGLFVVLFGIRRGEGASWSWMGTVAIQVGKEILISGPLQVFFINTMVPRFMAPIIESLHSEDPLVLREGALSVRIANAFHRDMELRAAAATLLCKGGEFNYIAAEKLAAKLGVDSKRWAEETGGGMTAADAADAPELHQERRLFSEPGNDDMLVGNVESGSAAITRL
jgi:hypothetical protein